MCFPAIGAAIAPAAGAGVQTLLGISTVASIASPLVAYAGQQQQAKAQAQYQAQAQEAERQRFQQEQSAIRLKEAQEQIAANEELADIARSTKAAMGTATTLAANRNVTGLSLEAFYDDITRKAGDVEFRLAQQQGFRKTATGMALEQARFATQQRQIALSKPISRPSLALTGFQAFSGGLQAYATGRQIGSTYET
jgi:hypothetical protein